MTFAMLLTCVGGELSPQVIRTLKSSRRHDVRVVGVDMRDDASGRYFVDSFYTVPAGDSDEYIGVLSDIVDREDVDLVLPTSDLRSAGTVPSVATGSSGESANWRPRMPTPWR